MKKNTRFLLSILVIVIAISAYQAVKFKSGNIVFNEQASFGKLSLNRTTPFTVKNQKKLHVTIKLETEKGELVFFITSPSKEVVYKKEGKAINEDVELDVSKGTWLYTIQTKSEADNEDENGSFALKGELKK